MQTPFQKLRLYHSPDKLIPLDQGNPDASIWIILHQHEIEANHLPFLEKVFQSVHINIYRDAAIFSLPKNNTFRIYPLINQNKKHVFCFGLQSNQLGLNFNTSVYTIIELQRHTFLFCNSLEVIQKSSFDKKQLWSLLKQIAPALNET